SPIFEKLAVEDRLSQPRTGVEQSKRTDDRVDAGKAGKAESRKIDLLLCAGDICGYFRVQLVKRAQAICRGSPLFLCTCKDRQIVDQPSLYRRSERERQGLRRYGPAGNTASQYLGV